MGKAAAIAFLSSLLLAGPGAMAVPGAAASTLKTDIEKVLQEEGLTGAAWSLVDGEKITLGAAGLRDGKDGIAFTTDTRFHVGSVTKTLIATGVLRLVTTGAIELDAPAETVLPGMSFDNPWGDTDPVTVRHILDHTAGLDDARLWQMFSERAEPDAPLSETFPEPGKMLRVRSKPGTRFSYSNMGYTLLAMIIETATGERYESYLDRQLLKPLGMTDSTFTFTTQQGEEADPSLAWGHIDINTRYVAAPVFLRPAAQFTTSAADLATFAQFLLSDGVIDAQAFIDPTLMRARGRPSTTDAFGQGLTAGYALGLGRRDRHGVIGFCHAGNTVGFVAMLCVFPDEQKAFAISTNTDSETANYGRLDALLIDALDVNDAQVPESSEPATNSQDWLGWYVLRPNRFQTFEYLDTVFGAMAVSAESDGLRLGYFDRDARRLRPLGGHIYSVNDRETASHVLLRGSGGEYQISDGFQTYEKVPLPYLAALWASIALGLAGLAWLFTAGLLALLRHRQRFLQQAIAAAFLAICFLLLPIPLFFLQSFMALGDLTPASGLLALATGVLPLGMMWTAYVSLKSAAQNRFARLHGIAAILVLQWCVVLVFAGLLPLRLWV